MRTFLDLTGASGAQYRFRAWLAGKSHLPVAGNYVIVRETEKNVDVLVIGVTNDLSKLRQNIGQAQAQGATQVFTRLNVARAVRDMEHQDLLGAYPTPRVET